MEIEKAKEMVTSLANGIDPVTGEIFDVNSPYNHPSIIRALYTVLNHLKSPKKQSKSPIKDKQSKNIIAGKPRNAGLPWTDELKIEVAKLFKNGKSVSDMARYFERTEGSILSELVHQGLIEEKEKQIFRY